MPIALFFSNWREVPLQAVRFLLGLIILCASLEHLLHFEIYHASDFMMGLGKELLYATCIFSILFSFLKSRVWSLFVFVSTALYYRQTVWMTSGLEYSIVPFILFFCLYPIEKSDSKERSMALSLLLLQVVIMYFWNGLAKLEDDHFWRDGFLISKLLQEYSFLPFKFLSQLVIAIEMLSPLLMFKKLRRPMLVSYILLHCGVMVTIGLYYFQTMCILQLLCLWKVEGFYVPFARERLR